MALRNFRAASTRGSTPGATALDVGAGFTVATSPSEPTSRADAPNRGGHTIALVLSAQEVDSDTEHLELSEDLTVERESFIQCAASVDFEEGRWPLFLAPLQLL